MKKILTTAGVSVLSTLAAVGGVVGVLANAPSTKDKFSVSWSQTDLIGKNQENISNLEKEIAEKDNQIQGQRVTIDELNQMLNAGPESILIPDDIILHNGATIINATENISLFSSTAKSGTNGLWKINKETKEIIKLADVGYAWNFTFKLSDGRILLFSFGNIKNFIVLDSNFNLISVKENDSAIYLSGSDYKTIETDEYFIIGTLTSTTVTFINKTTLSIYREQSLYFSHSCVYGKYFINSYSSTALKIFDMESNSIEVIDTTTRYLPINTKNGIYLLSATSLSKLDFETKEISVVKDGLSLTLPSYYIEFEDGKYLTYGSNGSSIYSVCLLDVNTEDVLVLGKFIFNKVERYSENENILLFYSSTKFYSFDLETNELTDYVSSTGSTYVTFGTKYVGIFSSTNIQIRDIGGTGNILFLSGLYGSPKYSSCEDLGDGKYKFISESQIAVFDSVSNTFTIHSLIIE